MEAARLGETEGRGERPGEMADGADDGTEMQGSTKIGGYNVMGIFTNRLPATPDNAPYTYSLFDVGELPDKYWEIIYHNEGTFMDSHPGDIHHEHAFERIIAKRIV